MKTVLFVLFMAILAGCAGKKTDAEIGAKDSVSTIEQETQFTESDSIQSDDSDQSEYTDTESEVDEAAELEREANDPNYVNEYPQNLVDVADGIVRFVDPNSGAPFVIGMPWQEPVTEVPQFLKDNGIKFTLEKTEADPSDYESTDHYEYKFGKSIIIIAYDQVTRAEIYTPIIELDKGVKVGMSKADFLGLFPQLAGFESHDSYQLHVSSLTSACYLQFDFDKDRIVSIRLSIFVQDCG